MEFIEMKCPHCQASLDIKYDENQETAFCQYCGSKFTIDHQNIKRIEIVKRDEAEIIRAKAEAEKAKAERNLFWVFFKELNPEMRFVLLMILLGLLLTFYSELTKQKKNKSPCRSCDL